MAGADEKIRKAAEALRQAEAEKVADIQGIAEAEAQVERLRVQPVQPVAHVLQGLTELDPETTVTSIDGIGAFDTKMKLLEEGRARLERLRKEVEIVQQGPQIVPRIPANISGDVQKLQAMVAQLQSEKEVWSKKKDSPRLPEDFVCASHEDLIRWLGSPERHEQCIDGGERWGSGKDGCSREQGHQSVEAVDWAIWCRREWHVSVHGGEHRPVSQKLRLVVHRCGFLGCRVGEASNPGLVQTRQARRAEHDRLTARRQTQIDVSSDEEEPTVRPNIGRHVVARTNGAHGSVDDSDDAPVGRGAQIRTGEPGVPDAFVGTRSMLVSCPVLDVGFVASGEDDDIELPIVEPVAPVLPSAAAQRTGFTQLDQWDVDDIFSRRASVMKIVPRFLWGSFRIALKVAIEEILNGAARRNMVQQERGWKLFLLLPRMMLHRSPRGGLIGREKLISRFDKFAAGQWHDLIMASNKCAEEAATVRQRRARRVQGNQDDRRATRAFNFVQMGELSSGRQALEGEELAPGNEETLKELRKRVAATCVRQKRSSGRTISDDDRSSSTSWRAPEICTISSKWQSCWRGDREHCQHHQAREDDGTQEGWWRRAGDCCKGGDSESDCQAVEVTTAPFQYALSTRAGCECMVHVLQTLTELNPEAIVTSIDGISAYDSISRKAMVEGLARVPGGSAVLPFVHLFYAQPSV